MNPDASVLEVRRSIHVRATPVHVWEAFKSKARMDEWWGATKGIPEAGTSQGQRLAVYDPRVGGHVEMEVMLDRIPARYRGKIKTFESGRELTFENDWISNRGWLLPTLITLRLTAVLGGTLVELFHYGFERRGI